MLVCGTAVRCKGLRGGLRWVLRDNSIKSLWLEKNRKVGLLLAFIKDSSKRTTETSAFPLMKILLTFSLHLKQF